MNLLTQQQAESLASDAMALMDGQHDSFGPIDAVRALRQYDDMTPDQREQVTRLVQSWCAGGGE